MYVSELNLAVDELLGPFERNDQLLYRKATEISSWTCGQHVSHVLKMNMSIIDDLILLAYKNLEIRKKIHVTGKASLFFRSLIYDDDKSDDFLPEKPLVINSNWLKKTNQEWDNKMSILKEMDISWKNKILPMPDSTMGYMTGENWIRYITMHTYRHISVINKILSSNKKNVDLLIDQPTDYDMLLRIKSLSMN